MWILDNAKEIANSVHEIKNLELYARVLDLNAGIMDLIEENRRLHNENDDLKKKFQLREKMDFRESLYFQDGDNTPFCPHCWEKNTVALHLFKVWSHEDSTRWRCYSCDFGHTEDHSPRG